MMNDRDNSRRHLDLSINQRRRQIAQFDEQLRVFKARGTNEEERAQVITRRRELSAAQGYETGSARRQDIARRQPTPMQRGVPVIVA